MVLAAIFGMTLKFSSCTLSQLYRQFNKDGSVSGGPMYYLTRGIRQRWLGRPLGAMFAIFTACAAFGIGNMVQSNSLADAIQGAFGVPEWLTGALVAVGLAVVVLGGVRSIGRVTSILVPAMVLLYMIGCGWAPSPGSSGSIGTSRGSWTSIAVRMTVR